MLVLKFAQINYERETYHNTNNCYFEYVFNIETSICVFIAHDVNKNFTCKLEQLTKVYTKHTNRMRF